MNTLIPCTLVSNTLLLRTYARGKWIDCNELRKLCFVKARRHNESLSDHVYKNRLDMIFPEDSRHGMMVCKALSALAGEHLTVKANLVRIKDNQLDSWQTLLTRVPPLPVISYALFKNKRPEAAACLAKTALPDVCTDGWKIPKDHGFTDIHVHLNGSTETDWVWQDALKRPNTFGRAVVDSIQGTAYEQFMQLDEDLGPGDLRPLLNIASNIRIEMVNLLTKRGTHHDRRTYEHMFSTAGPWIRPLGLRRTHPYANNCPQSLPDSDLTAEAHFLMDVFKHIKKEASPTMGRLLHYYILIQCYLNKLLVQQTTQKGFDQFQKITLNGMREFSEISYFRRRFEQMEGMSGGKLEFIEGRFAPKENGKKLCLLLSKIINEYNRYRNSHLPPDGDTNGKNMKMSLVGHFIKKPTLKFCCCQHYRLRRSVEKQARLLIQLRRISLFKEYVQGCDAASNEMHTPPEVFAPVFRRLRHHGISHFTYHAGEDFVHLAGGIRAVYEAIIFLGLTHGDRIGHATALGIAPGIWKQTMGKYVVMRRTQWLDDLVFAWEILGSGHCLKNKIENEIRSLSYQVYGRPIQADLLHRAWKMRSLDPIKALVDNWKELLVLSDFDRAEWTKIRTTRTADQDAFNIFSAYHQKHINDQTWGTSSKAYIEVCTDFFSDDDLLSLQRAVLQEVHEQKLALEVMPTSNVRISCYNTHCEHHIYTWLNLNVDKDYPEPDVCLGTDDPGIFATNIRNEYAHVRNGLIRKCKLSETDADYVLSHIMKTSNKFRFIE